MIEKNRALFLAGIRAINPVVVTDGCNVVAAMLAFLTLETGGRSHDS